MAWRMRVLCFLMTAFVAWSSADGADLGEDFSIAVDVSRPATRDRHTSLLADFDSATDNNAQHAWGLPLAGGYENQPKAPGKFGDGVGLPGWISQLHYRGEGNLNPARGTVQFWVKSGPKLDLWKSDKEHWLFGARFSEGPVLVLARRPVERVLELCWRGGRRKAIIGSVKLPLAGIDPARWRHIALSWDLNPGRLWLAVDGKGRTAAVAKPPAVGECYAIFVGAGIRHRARSIYGCLDDLKITDQSIGQVLSLKKNGTPVKGAEKLDDELLVRTEAGARKWFDLLLRTQHMGGWRMAVSWPTLLGSSTGSRGHIQPADHVDNDKSCGTAVAAARMLFAYEVLGDQRYLESAKAAGDLLLAAQKISKHHGWHRVYRVNMRGGIQIPYANPRYLDIQDSVQSHPILFLASLYRATKDERYLRGAISGGELLLKMQNPNGSWSYRWDTVDKIGKTARGLPGGGEFNDLAVSDALRVMILMYHLTKEKKYLRAFSRCADWIIAAQQKGPVPGWCQQYDADNNAVWARPFEPPSVYLEPCNFAIRDLGFAYEMTRDRKYTAAIRRWLDWLRSRKRLYPYYDPKTGRPIWGHHRKIYFLDDPRERAELKRIFKEEGTGRAPRGRSMSNPRWRRWLAGPTKRLEAMEKGTHQPSRRETTLQEAYADCVSPARRREIERTLKTQTDAGILSFDPHMHGSTTIGGGFHPRARAGSDLLRFVERCRMCLGELTHEQRGWGDLYQACWPRDSWYDTPLRAGRGGVK